MSKFIALSGGEIRARIRRASGFTLCKFIEHHRFIPDTVAVGLKLWNADASRAQWKSIKGLRLQIADEGWQQFEVVVEPGILMSEDQVMAHFRKFEETSRMLGHDPDKLRIFVEWDGLRPIECTHLDGDRLDLVLGEAI